MSLLYTLTEGTLLLANSVTHCVVVSTQYQLKKALI